jgi:hypothetical protein
MSVSGYRIRVSRKARGIGDRHGQPHNLGQRFLTQVKSFVNTIKVIEASFPILAAGTRK